MDKIVDLIKQGKIREISDMRDETDLGGLKLTIDCKRGTDPDRLMQKLFRMTPLEAYSRPRQNGVNAIIIRDDDRLIGVEMTDGNAEILLPKANESSPST